MSAKDFQPTPYSSIKQEIFRSSIFPTLIIITLIGGIFSSVLYHIEITKAQESINRTNRAIEIYIEEYFTEIIDTLINLSEDEEINNAGSLGKESHNRILNDYLSIRTSNRNFKRIYSGYDNGLLLINDYTPPNNYDPTIRPWYTRAMLKKPDISVGKPYQDIYTKEWMISTGKALKHSDGKYRGVVSIDVLADRIGNYFARFNEYETEFSFVINKNHEIIMHADQSLLNTQFVETQNILKLNAKGSFVYQYNDIEYLAYYRHITKTNWMVITVVEKQEIMSPIIIRVLTVIFLTLFTALFLAFIQSIKLSTRLSQPLFELNKKIKAVISHTQLDEKYTYPNNEIGMIADEIGQLAEREINAKSSQLQASKHQYHLFIENSTSAITSRQIIRDDNGLAVDYVYLDINSAYSHFMGLPGPSIIGYAYKEIKNQAEPPYLALCDNVVKSGKSCSFEHYSPELEKYYLINVFCTGEDCFGTIFMDITDSKRSEQQIQELLVQVETERDIAQKCSQTDGLTGLYNRRFFDEVLNKEFSRHKRSASPLSLIMLDIDFFKKYNDHYGHVRGDECLVSVTRTLKLVVTRITDVLARYGGEEFAIILPDTGSQGAENLARRILKSIEDLKLPHANSDISEFVSMSIGIATATEPLLLDKIQLIELADKALYQAKENGRNRYEVLTVESKLPE